MSTLFLKKNKKCFFLIILVFKRERCYNIIINRR
uniref:Uncharacterized protein n=1 Tax=Siphoviridae sp. ctJjf17 TaxID=2827839 RepID=A0A8S5S9Y8_9CAUD|nr:MAG TPA: hypothetical protein [Siphoviridae sp. ctJjf17]